MAGAYAYADGDTTILIGNDYIERRFSTSGDRLRTEEIVNRRIDGGLSLKLTSFSAEFFIGFKTGGVFHSKTEFLSSNELTVDNVNIFKNRVEFIFKPYAFSGARITFILNIEVDDDTPYMSKYIEMIVDERFQQNITVDYIDCEHLCFTECKEQWCIGEVPKAFLSPYHSSLGQPFYLNGMFFASTFPLAESNISKGTAYIRYFSGKRFDKLNLNCGTTYRTWSTVSGAAESADYNSVRREFLDYVRFVSREIKPRFQYNSWYDHMLDITEENVTKSFTEIEDGLSKALIPPIDSYVVDDGFSDYRGDFWNFNSKFPNGFEKISLLTRKFSSNFGMWLGPRGGYNDETGSFARRMQRAGKGGYNIRSNDVCVADKRYIKNVTDYFIDCMNRFDINYWKLDGFLLKACPSKKHGHVTGGFKDMYEYTEMWENWIDVFRKMRIHRETKGGNLWLNQTSYCNASPFFLQWSDSLWIQNSSDVEFLQKTKSGEKLLTSDVDKLLSYRDSRYYDFFIRRKYQVPPEYLYNHDPIYGNSAKVSMTDSEYRKYLFMMSARGNFFWELYYSYNMLSPSKWRINADVFRFIKNNADVLKNSVFIGSDPEESGGIYGYSAWTEKKGIVALRNPSNREQEFTFSLNKTMGCVEFQGEMKRATVLPYTEKCDTEMYAYGDSFTVTLKPAEAVLMKFSASKERVSKLIYGKFVSSTELLLFFDGRIYLSPSMVSSDKKIASLDLLEDYATLKITFEEEAEKAYVSLTVMNAFGDLADAEINAEFYPDFICSENKIPNGRDFTISLSLEKTESCCLIKTDGLTLNISDGGISVRLCECKSKFETDISENDRITLVCEPNALIKIYKNTELLGSVFDKSYVSSLAGQKIEFSDNAKDLKILSRAIKYTETEQML